MKQVCITSAAGAEGFESERGETGLAKMGQEQRGQDSFANASVGAGDEYNSRSSGASHAQELTTDEHRLTRIFAFKRSQEKSDDEATNTFERLTCRGSSPRLRAPRRKGIFYESFGL